MTEEKNINRGVSYDERMEDMPLFVSYPRSGSNWLNCLMELYFNIPRLRDGPVTFLKGKYPYQEYLELYRSKNCRRDYMWFHDHDRDADLVVSHNNIMYMYRNPVDVIFSVLMAENRSKMIKISKTKIDMLLTREVNRLKKQYQKYINGDISKTIICYDDLKKDLGSEFQKILSFFEIEGNVDVEKLRHLNEKITLKSVIDKERDPRYFNKTMLADRYAKDRAEFRKIYANQIMKNFDGLITISS